MEIRGYITLGKLTVFLFVVFQFYLSTCVHSLTIKLPVVKNLMKTVGDEIRGNSNVGTLLEERFSYGSLDDDKIDANLRSRRRRRRRDLLSRHQKKNDMVEASRIRTMIVYGHKLKPKRIR